MTEVDRGAHQRADPLPAEPDRSGPGGAGGVEAPAGDPDRDGPEPVPAADDPNEEPDRWEWL